MTLEVLAPGIQMTLQDLGRTGWQRYGVRVCGAMDSLALRVANRLVGNPENTVAIEIVWSGPRLRFDDDAVIAIAGGAFDVTLNDRPLRLWESQHIPAGSVLAFGACRSGFRACLAVAGGFVADQVFGSGSTDLGARWGGLQGRALARGDRIEWRGPAGHPVAGRRANADLESEYETHLPIRVVLGPDEQLFGEGAIRSFFSSTYKITPRSDRQGYRLSGSIIESLCGPNLLSEAMPRGAIQIPRDGQPILLVADRQSVGGYPKIACCISADLCRAAQLPIGGSVSFSQVSLDQARRALVLQEGKIRKCC